MIEWNLPSSVRNGRRYNFRSLLGSPHIRRPELPRHTSQRRRPDRSLKEKLRDAATGCRSQFRYTPTSDPPECTRLPIEIVHQRVASRCQTRVHAELVTLDSALAKNATVTMRFARDSKLRLDTKRHRGTHHGVISNARIQRRLFNPGPEPMTMINSWGAVKVCHRRERLHVMLAVNHQSPASHFTITFAPLHQIQIPFTPIDNGRSLFCNLYSIGVSLSKSKV